jgi:two-component system, OmpR family, KDP operon response regulator KdpE
LREGVMIGEQQLEVAEEAKKIGRIWQHCRRILILVEDPELGDSLLEAMQSRGCAVALATSGREGLGLLRSGLVDLVVAEMGLPDLPGMSLLSEVQTMKKAPKVILTTKHCSEFLAARALDHGASAVLCWPFEMSQVLALAARALGD